MIELLTQRDNQLLMPAVQGEISWKTERKAAPGQLSFSVMLDGKYKAEEGDRVRFRYNGQNVFYGFIFSKKITQKDVMEITAYDQLRYFKNKDTYVYENLTLGELLQRICSDFNLQAGALENTGYRIPSRVEDEVELFEMVQNAIDVTMENTGRIYTMYDDFGKLALRNIESMRLNKVYMEDSMEGFDYSSGIDSDSYNKIKLFYDNDETGSREVYIAQDSANMNAWGILQYYESLQKGENGQVKAEALLKLYNKKQKSLVLKNLFGDVQARAGCMVPVVMDLVDVKLQNYMLVEKSQHTFTEHEHRMELTLRGGDIVA